MAKDFHGPPESKLETRVGELESVWAPCLTAVDRGDHLTPDQFDALRLLLWSLAARTNALRQQFARIYDDLLTELELAFARPETLAVMACYIRDNLDALVADSMRDQPGWKRILLTRLLKVRSIRERALAAVDDHVHSGDFASFLAPYFAAAREPARVLPAASDGQLRGLDGVISEGQSPAKFSPRAWSVLTHEGLILGDGCVVALAPDGRAGSLLRHSDAWRLCYVPINSTSILIAHNAGERHGLPAEQLNPASAALSHRHFWASYYSDELAELSATIGSGISWFDARETRDLVDQGIRGMIEEVDHPEQVASP